MSTTWRERCYKLYKYVSRPLTLTFLRTVDRRQGIHGRTNDITANPIKYRSGKSANDSHPTIKQTNLHQRCKYSRVNHAFLVAAGPGVKRYGLFYKDRTNKQFGRRGEFRTRNYLASSVSTLSHTHTHTHSHTFIKHLKTQCQLLSTVCS